MLLISILSWTGSAIVFFGLGLFFSNLRSHNSHIEWLYYGCYGWGNAMLLPQALIETNYLHIYINTTFAIWFLYLWWKNRHNRKKRNLLQKLGEKSRAIIKKMVEKLVPSPTPSPVGSF